MKTIRLNITVIMLLCIAVSIAQTKKFDKVFKTNNNVTVDIDARHTQVNVE